MVVTKNVKLPEFADLTVDEVNLSTATLMSAGPFFAKACEGINNEFMLCRLESNDPTQCVALGKGVTACTLDFFKKLKSNCLDEFNQYANCVDKSSGNYSFRNCRKTQAVLDECMADKMCISRPDFGYFCRPRVHETRLKALPKEPCPCHPKAKNATDFLPDCMPRTPARFGSRFYWFTE